MLRDLRNPIKKTGTAFAYKNSFYIVSEKKATFKKAIYANKRICFSILILENEEIEFLVFCTSF